MNRELQHLRSSPSRIALLLLAIGALALVYLFQKSDFLSWICQCEVHPSIHFAVNKFVRVFLNDIIMLWIIHLWFADRSITKLAFWIQLIDTFLLLPIYLLLKLSIEGHSEISSPLLSQFHRLIVNPTLMILIFPAVYFQRSKSD